MPLPLGTVLVRTLPIVSMDKMVVIVNIWTYITVDEPKSNTIIIWTPIFERYVTMWCESKNWYEEDMCLKDIGLRVQKMLGILSLIINMIEEKCMTT